MQEDVAREALRLTAHKLPIKCKFVVRSRKWWKQMKASEIRETEQELNEGYGIKSELFKLRFQHTTNQLDNPIKLEMLKVIARVKTVIRERELEGKTCNVFERR